MSFATKVPRGPGVIPLITLVLLLIFGVGGALADGADLSRAERMTALVGSGSGVPNSSWAGLSAKATNPAATTGSGVDPARLALAPNGPNNLHIESEVSAPAAVDPSSVPRSLNGLGPEPEEVTSRSVRLDPDDLPANANLEGSAIAWLPVRDLGEASPESFPASGAEATLFPATGDVVNAATGNWYYQTGNYAEGVRNTALSVVDAVRYELVVSTNALSGGAQVDFDLSLNGSVVGSFTVFEGEVSKSLIFTFPAIAGPNYTIRLEETNTVPGGLGSILLNLDLSSLTLYDNATSPYFPATGDEVVTSIGNWYFQTGEYAEGTRTPGLPRVNALTYDLDVTTNALNSGAQVDFDLSINGVVVGSFSVPEGETSKSLHYVFPPVTGPVYTVRLEETNTVPGGQGSVEIGLDVSELTFYDNATSQYFPATGDLVEVANPSEFWFNLGDQAEGTREPGLASVSAARYEFLPGNFLNTDGQLDLDLVINGTVVGSFTLYPGQNGQIVQFAFPPIPGPVYTVRLEETNTVLPGRGSIQVPLDTSILTLYDSAGSPFFPATGDVYTVNSVPDWFWVTNDQVEGVRTPGLATVNGATYKWRTTANALSSTGHVDLDLSINGTVVGSFTVNVGETEVLRSFAFPAIAGPNYTIRLTATNTVASGLGSMRVPVDISELTLFDNAPVAVDDAQGPSRTWLHAAAPNPFTEQMRIDFDLARGGNVGLYVYDAAGRRVATLAQGQYNAGRHVAVWNGRNEQGVSAKAGTYFVKMITPNATKTRKIVHIN